MAKRVYHPGGADARTRGVAQTLEPRALLPFNGNLPRCVVAIEACGGVYHWARKVTWLDRTVRVIRAQFVKTFVKQQE
jgi:transposase